jgi:hypothetical protein
LNSLDLFGFKQFVPAIAAGGALGLIFGIVIVAAMARRGLFRRRLLVHSLAVKCFMPYIPLVLMAACALLALVLGVRQSASELLGSSRGSLISATSAAAGKAFSEMALALGGGDLPYEFIPNTSEVIVVFVDDAASEVIAQDPVLEEMAGPVRFGLKMSLKEALEGAQVSRFPKAADIPASEFYGPFREEALSRFQLGLYPDALWDSLAPSFSSAALRIVWTTFLFLFPVCFEMAVFLLFLRGRRALPKRAPRGRRGRAAIPARAPREAPSPESGAAPGASLH